MIIHSILDCDDNANAPATAAGVDQLRQYQTYKVANLIANAQRGVGYYFPSHDTIPTTNLAQSIGISFFSCLISSSV